jgi:hypothetical protein
MRNDDDGKGSCRDHGLHGASDQIADQKQSLRNSKPKAIEWHTINRPTDGKYHP